MGVPWPERLRRSADRGRGLTEGAAVPGQVWPVLLVWAIAGVWLAVTLFRWEPPD